MALQGDDELLTRDTRGADGADAKIPAHDVTSNAVEGQSSGNGRESPAPRGESANAFDVGSA
jgi:hypothetical protein